MASDEKRNVELVEDIENIDSVDPYSSTTITYWTSVKENPKVLLYTGLMTSGAMAFGFDIIIVGVITAVPAFLENFGEPLGPTYIVPSLWLSLWNAFMQIGFMIGAVINGLLSDRFGRKASMALGSTIANLAILIIYLSDRPSDVDHRRGLFLVGKTIIGVGLSMMMATTGTYVSEIAPPRLRGPMLSSFQFLLILGQLVAAGAAHSQLSIGFKPESYRICFATQWACSGLAFVAAIIVPESPAFLLRHGKVEAARKSIARLHEPESVEGSIVALMSILEHEKQMQSQSQDASYMECFKGSNWRRTRIVIYASIIQQFLGTTFVANGTYFMIIGGLSPVHTIMVLEICLGIALIANLGSWVLASTLGRRRTFYGNSFFLGAIWMSVGIAGCYSSKAALWYAGVTINAVLVFFNMGAGGIIPIIIAETSSIRLRAKTTGIGFLCNGFSSWAFNFFVPYMFNRDEGNWGAKTGFFFAGLSLLAGALIFWEIPEMKNRTYTQLDEMFEKSIPTRKFAKYECVGTSTAYGNKPSA
ncbi:maltose permease MAL61 [Leptodontidium sp. MPI-SDFR-AT-0119]|nr:maltose permease MAL61 [Leptodontidium sp. MPI-SDFR-AT-0119]